MWVRVELAAMLLAATVVAASSSCTAGGHHAAPTSSGRSSASQSAGAQDGEESLSVVGDGVASSAGPGVASFFVTNIDAGAIIVSPSSRTPVRLACPGSATVEVDVGNRSRELTVLQQRSGQVLLRTPIRAGGQWYVLG